jgi:acyl-CoA-binding protein
MDNKELNDMFIKAVEFFNNNKKKLIISNEIKLELYGLYKVANNIKYKSVSLFTFDPLKITKNKAHFKYKDITIEEAKKKYIDIYKSIYKNN